MRTLYFALFCLILSGIARGAEVQSPAQIVDADTAYVAGVKIRLSGIDAPEMDQKCIDSQGRDSFCGVDAKVRLEDFTKNRTWYCQLNGRDRYGRSLGLCRVEGEDVSRWLVRNGLALAFRRYSTAYVEDEVYARENKLGLWAGSFIAPWDWRRRNDKTEVLGALSVPTEAQKRLISPVSVAPPVGCAIKGNLKSRTECIYHIPGQRFYQTLQITPTTSRRWFCSEAEAQAAGCRKSRI